MNTRFQVGEHERATIRAFVEPSKQERFLGFLSQPRTRKKFIKDLNNFRWFDQRFATAIVLEGRSNPKALEEASSGDSNYLSPSPVERRREKLLRDVRGQGIGRKRA